MRKSESNKFGRPVVHLAIRLRETDILVPWYWGKQSFQVGVQHSFRLLITDLLRNIRTQVLMKLIKPYTRIHIPFISKELNIDANEVENLLVSCILDNTVQGRIDQVNQVLELNRENACSSRYNAVDKWTTQLNSLYNTIMSKVI